METIGNGMEALHQACLANLVECHRLNLETEWLFGGLGILLLSILGLYGWAWLTMGAQSFFSPPPPPPPPPSFDEWKRRL